MYTPGKLYFYVHVLQFDNFCHIESIFILIHITVSIKKNTLRSQALVIIAYSQIQRDEICLNP